jgi:two-component system LytT family response regulator
VADVIWIATAANYVEVHLATRLVLHRATITAMAARLPADQFMRLHRTALVRRSAIRSLHVKPDGSHAVVLTNGDQVRVSDSFVRDVQAMFA